MGKNINENERLLVDAIGELIANKIKSIIIDTHKAFNIEKPSFAMIASMLIIAIVDVVQDFADAHGVSLIEEMEGFADALMHAAKDVTKLKNKKEEKEENKEDGKE